MTDEQIKRVVDHTVNTLLKNKMIKYSDNIIYDTVSSKLRAHYNNTPNLLINQALNELKDEEYFEVLEMYYKDNMTLEEVAEELDKDISTVTRNKKALCIKIFNIIG